MESEQSETIEPWRHCWRNGFAPLLSTAGLMALREALVADDRRLLQAATTLPPPIACVGTWPVEACCPVSYTFVGDLGGWAPKKPPEGHPFATVAAVEERFAMACFACDRELLEPAGCRFFIGWWDTTDRKQASTLLLDEVELVLAERGAL